jgi:HPt (histidine-containing phosphotransfer) domain-containing protein
MTGNVLPQQVRSYLDAGMNDHIGKPIERAQLYNNVRRWLPKTRDPRVQLGPNSLSVDKPNLTELVDVVGAEKAKRIATKFLGDLTEAFKFKCTLADAQRQAHALINCAGVLGLQNLVAACRAVELVSAEDADQGVAAVEEVRREQSVARQAVLSDLLPRLSEMALRPMESEASANASSACQARPRLDAEANVQIGRPALWT